MVPEALQNVRVYQPPPLRKPREKKVINYKDHDDDDDEGVFDEFEDEFNPGDWREMVEPQREHIVSRPPPNRR